MAARPTQLTLLPVRLDSKEQWLLHCVLEDRVTAWRRRPGVSPPPVETRWALEKVQSGSLLFTPAELRRAREAIDSYRRRRGVAPSEDRALRRIVDRIGRALAGRPATALG